MNNIVPKENVRLAAFISGFGVSGLSGPTIMNGE